MLVGLAMFGAGSLVAAWAGSVGVLVAARAAMGLGAAIITPTVLAVLTVLFPGPERGRAVSWVVIGVGAGLPLGPIVAGYLLDRFWWGSIFLINVPVALLAIAAIGVLLADSRDRRPRRADLPGGLLSTTGLVAFVFGMVEAPGRGWTDPMVGAAAVGAVMLVAGSVAWELHTPEPMFDLRLFARPQLAWGTGMVIALAAWAAVALLGAALTAAFLPGRPQGGKSNERSRPSPGFPTGNARDGRRQRGQPERTGPSGLHRPARVPGHHRGLLGVRQGQRSPAEDR